MSFARHPAVRIAAVLVRLAAIVGYIVATNPGVMQRVLLLQNQGRWTTLAFFVALWGLSVGALLIVAFHRSIWVRGLWAAVIAGSSAVGFTYQKASGTDFGIFDALSLWSARHEAGRAMDFYGSELIILALVAAGGLLVLTAPPVIRVAWVQRWLTRFAWTPVVPVVLIAAIIVIKEGGGSQALPTQFGPLSVGAVAAVKIASSEVPTRRTIAWTPGRRQVRHVVMLVDESVRGDYIDWTAGNAFTPELARLRPRLVDFGPAASAGNCSHYSNALLRFAAARKHLGSGVLRNPTLWQYAKRAGYRTVFIDAQSAFNRNPGKLQNFMTADETGDIDRVVTMPASVPAPELDDRLLDIVVEELRSDQPVFIYANKNGAHFPYDASYPASERPFRPVMADALAKAVGDGAQRTISTYAKAAPVRARINSYRNAVRWTVDRFFKRLFDEARLDDSVVLYTSDHGQAFDPDRLSHCTIENPDPREGLVPLFVSTPRTDLRDRFAKGVQTSTPDHASHFQIAPTLLELFGYAKQDIGGTYGPSLFDRNAEPAGFTSGDIFGLFSGHVRWHPLDLGRRYLEPDAVKAPPRNVSANSTGSDRQVR